MNTNQARNWQRDNVQPERQQQKKIVVKVRKNSWLTKGEKMIYAFFSLILIMVGLYIVSFSSTTDTLNRNLQNMEQQVQQKKLENESLMFEVSELSKPERITKIAKENGLKIQDTKVKRAIHSND
ncbi:cell division protein FtsL [Pseudogracilibacillus auburnensis]|uniref:Cell division protein FtsL n=1 Tax=Pseudogracilibacillus auburnensis TaxID=1494959 RepID=A0A2V3W349_9BACI|nr:cell division protein FtsL [Pseudogracilibacillus auburnensis]PXW88512.1 cell division protein FtsL [Pseudogracilibacillus auburnensis]